MGRDRFRLGLLAGFLRVGLPAGHPARAPGCHRSKIEGRGNRTTVGISKMIQSDLLKRNGPKRWTRRDFHRIAAICAATAGTARAQQPASQMYFDMHTHLGQTWNSTQVLTAETLLRWMDAHAIVQAVVLPLVSPESSSYPLTTDFVLAQTARFRDRLVPFCSIDPRTSFRGGHQGLVDMLRRYVDAGAKGFGEHKPGIAFDDPLNLQLFAACQEVGLPVLFHLDAQRNRDAPGLPGLEKVLRETPECIFVGHGPGWWASISGDASDLGGYPKGPVTPGGAMDRLMDAYPNLYGELSAGSGANAIGRDLKFGREFLERRRKRILFGTDFLSPGQEVPQFELFEQQLSLEPDTLNSILRDNARRILKLDE